MIELCHKNKIYSNICINIAQTVCSVLIFTLNIAHCYGEQLYTDENKCYP